MSPHLCTKCCTGKKLDRSTWSVKSITGGSCLLSRIGSTDVSLARMQTISRGEGWGHCLYSGELARTSCKLNVAAISVAQSMPSRPSIKKCKVVGLGSLLEVMV